MFIKYFLVASTLLYGANALFGSMKNVTVKGRLQCGYGPANGVTVELWEDDTFLGYGKVHKLNETKTDYSGYFEIYGQKKEIFNIEPFLLIKHTCQRKGDRRECEITDRVDIPKKYQGRTFKFRPLQLGPDRRGRKKWCR